MTLPQEDVIKAIVITDEAQRDDITHTHLLFSKESNEGKVYLSVKATTSLNQLRDLNESLQSTVKPIDPYRSLWVGLKDCNLFMKYFEIFIDSKVLCGPNQFKQLASCFSKIKNLLNQLLTSELITHDQITIEGRVDIKRVYKYLNEDFERIYNAVAYEEEQSTSSLCGVKSMINLREALPTVGIVLKVCDELHLTGCTEDPKFIYLKDIYSSNVIEEEISMSSLSVKAATEYMKVVEDYLHYNEMLKLKLSPLFQCVLNARTFCDFIQDQFFSGNHTVESATDSFRTWHQIISTQIQNEDFEEQVLREISHAFACIIPFIDKRQSFDTLITKVLLVDPSNNFLELQTMTENMHIIKRWSVQAEVRKILADIHNNIIRFLKIAMI